MTYNQQNLLPILQKNGNLFDWSKHFNIYDSQTLDSAPIALGWKQGRLKVKVKYFTFTQTFYSIQNFCKVDESQTLTLR